MREFANIVLRILLANIILWSAILVILKGVVNKITREVVDKFKGKIILRIIPSANFFGFQSRGLRQMRGNGILALTEEELYFRMWVPKREFHILISSIIRVETPKSHLGKSKFRPLLKVTFKDNDDKEDSVAWLVRDLQQWEVAIDTLIQGKE